MALTIPSLQGHILINHVDYDIILSSQCGHFWILIDRTMYFSDWGTVGRIEKATLTGANRTVIHNTSLVWPNALTLDIPTQTLYWADASLDKVEKSNVDGTNRVLLAQRGVVHPFGIVFVNNTLYFTDWSDNTIRYLSASGGTVSSLHSATAYSNATISGVQIVDPLRQFSGIL
jgi:sugar lactone lactonase YvrE